MGHDPAKSDQEILAYLYDYLEWLLQQPNLEKWSDGFFHQLQNRIAQVDSIIRSGMPEEREALIGYFHEYLLVVTVKAVKVSVMCAICKSACEKLSLKFQTGISLDKTVKYVHSLQELVLELFKNLQDLDLHKSFHRNDLELYMKKSMAHKLVQHLLQDCDELVTRCAVCVRGKTTSESLFFKVACCCVGALGLGRLVYSVYHNVSLEEMVRTGLWVACAGATAAVLHIPRIALQETTDLMAFHESQCVTMMSMVKPWLRHVPSSGGCNGLNSPILIRPSHAQIE